MRNGYYLSTYICVNELGNVYNLFSRHDQNMALWKYEDNKVELVKFWELERKTGQKGHCKSFYNIEDAKRFMSDCLAECNLSLEDINEIWGTPEFVQAGDRTVPVDKEISEHAINHLYSSLLSDTDKFYNNTIIGLAVDGGPDNVIDKDAFSKKYYAGCVSVNGQIEVFPVYSPGMLWDRMRHLTGLREGSLMALATASKSQYYGEEFPLLLIDDYNSMMEAYKKLDVIYDDIFGLKEEDTGKKFSGFDSMFSEQDNKISMVAKVVQEISIKIMEYNIETICKKYGLKSEQCILALAGGYGLNCPTNSHLCIKYKFKDFLAVPCISDSGVALGIGLRTFFHSIQGKMDFSFGNAYKGSCDNDMSKLDKYKEFIQQIDELTPEVWVADIQNAPVVWFDAEAEIGPRALGHRSIIADPRSDKSKDRLNVVKIREWWRPVAPIVLEEHSDEWFEMCCRETPFMLHTCKIREDKRDKVPAIAHLDGTARVQTMKQEDDVRLYMLITEFYKETGVPIICNTSLNDKGEPIIDSIDQAMNFALRKEFEVIYINGKRIALKNHQNYTKTTVEEREWREFVAIDEAKQLERENKINPYHVPKDVIAYAMIFWELEESMDLLTEEGAAKITKIVSRMSKINPMDVETFFLN